MRVSQLTYRSAVFVRDGYWCSYCAKPLTLGTATVDHVEPRAKGGIHHPDNMVVCCKACNGRKGEMSLLAFLHGDPFPVIAPPVLIRHDAPKKKWPKLLTKKESLYHQMLERIKNLPPVQRERTHRRFQPTLRVPLAEMFPQLLSENNA